MALLAARRSDRRTPVELPVVSAVEPLTGSPVLDAAGRRRSPATMPGFHAGRPPRNKGLRYPADPPTVEEIVAVMRIAGDGGHGRRLRGLVVVLLRAGLRIDEALSLREADLDRRRGSLLVRRGKGGRRREVGMDDSGWQELEPWLIVRVALPIVRCSASSTDARAGAREPPAGHAPSSDAPPPGPACADASLPISYATRTRSRWPAKASR
jgi:integrase